MAYDKNHSDPILQLQLKTKALHSNTQEDLKQLNNRCPLNGTCQIRKHILSRPRIDTKGFVQQLEKPFRLLGSQSTPFTILRSKEAGKWKKEKACKWGWKPQKAFSRKAIRFLVRKGGWLEITERSFKRVFQKGDLSMVDGLRKDCVPWGIK